MNVSSEMSPPAAPRVQRPRLRDGEVVTGPLVIIPFFRNEGLVAPLFQSLILCGEELRRIGARVVAIDDSPGYSPLAAALAEVTAKAADAFDLTVVMNAANCGFVRSVNRGLEMALDEGRDAILLNSDTVVFPGAFSEMARVATIDPMIAFVNPRSNNATIASLPVQDAYSSRPPRDAFETFRHLSGHLPEFHFVPTVSGFCMLIKHVVLREFGLLDEVYGAGYNEENDLVMRANRCGYRAVLANRAFVYHEGEASFTSPIRRDRELANSQILAQRYPEYQAAVAKYFSSPIHEAERHLTAMLPDSHGRYDLVFDFSDFGSYHNGTIEAGKALLHEFLRMHGSRYTVSIIMHAEHARYHGLDRVARLQVLPVDTDRQFAVGIRVGQPMTYASFSRLDRLAVRTAWFMLDTITWDCLYLDNPELEHAWTNVFDVGDAVIYNSEYTREQFSRRFPAAPGMRHLVSPHSLDPGEYLPPLPPEKANDFIFVVGNKFAHKFVVPTIDALVKAVPDQQIVCVGLERHPHHRVTCYSSGFLSDEKVETLYAHARYVVFPSMYEGFGFPLLKGMAYEKPVLMRDGPLGRDMKQRLGGSPNIRLYADTLELTQIVRHAPPSWQPGNAFPERHGWARSAAEIGDLVETLISATGAHAGLVRRIRRRREQTATSSPVLTHEEAVQASLPRSLRAVRSAVIRAPWLRNAVRPLWRYVWRITH